VPSAGRSGGRTGRRWRARPRLESASVGAAVVVLWLSATACSSLLHRDLAPPAGVVAASTPWAGVFHSNDLPPGAGSLTAVSCPTVRTCWATVSTVGIGVGTNGATVVATRNGGASWTLEGVPPTIGYLSGISCRDVTHCVAVGQTAGAAGTEGVALWTANGGHTWTVLPPITGTSDVTAVTCLSNGHCLAVASGPGGATALVSTSSGTRWQVGGPLPQGTLGATAVSCADATHCWVTGQVALDVAHVAGSVDFTTDLGATWTAVPLPPGTGMLGGVACAPGTGAGASLPFGQGGTAGSTEPGGAAGPGVTAANAAEAAAAPTPPTAAATTAAPPATTSTSTVPPTSSVPTTTTTTVPGVPGFRCTVVGTTTTALSAPRAGHAVILTTTDGGSSWQAARVPPQVAGFSGLSCPATGSCVAVGTTVASSGASGVVLLTGNGQDPWRRAVTVTVPQPLAAVSCPALAHCVMGGVSVSEQLEASS
jgi:hypothetical protein